MCSLIGYSGTEPVDPTDIKILLLFSQTRGSHATGFATATEVEKANDHPTYFVATRKIPETNLIIGHTRNPSFNNKKQENNAQPFEFDRFLGAHNGYFKNSYKMRQKYNLSWERSDSYMFFYGMNETSFREAISDSDPADDVAITWIDKEKKTLNLFRDGKPLFVGQKNGGIYFASEKSFLKAIDCDVITDIKEEHHYVIKDGEIKSKKKVEYIIPKHKQISGFTHNYQKTNHKYKDHDSTTEYSNVPKVGALYAPKDAHSIFINGKKHYYWIKETVVYVETCITYKNSEKKEYNLANDGDARKLGRDYYRILKSVNEILE